MQSFIDVQGQIDFCKLEYLSNFCCLPEREAVNRYPINSLLFLLSKLKHLLKETCDCQFIFFLIVFVESTLEDATHIILL